MSLLIVKTLTVFTLLAGWNAPILAQTNRDRQLAWEVLRESEERLRLALDIANLGRWDWNILNNQLWWCDRQEQLFGIASGSFGGTYEAFLEYIHPEERMFVAQNLTRALENKQDYYDEFRVIWPDNTVHWILAKGRCFDDETGRAVRMSGVCMDVTDTRQLHEQRNRLLQLEQATRTKSEAANRMKDEFLSILSHEIRTPMTSVLGWIRILRTSMLNPQKAARGLEALERNARVQVQVIDDLLDVAHIIQGKLRLQVCPIDLVSAIKVAIETVRPAIDAKGIQLNTQLDPTASWFLGDYNRLQQVVWNLISNAIKFTPQGGKVEVVLERFDSHVEMRVSDTGQGISADFLPYVFDRFRQEDSTITRWHGGLGLGLVIVRYLVELHGGTVTVASSGEGQGATFTVKLPLRAVNRGTPSSQHAINGGEEGDLAHVLNGLRVLVVDDEVDGRELVSFLLEQSGAEVTTASCASEAMDALARTKPDVLLSDIGLPDEDGCALMRKIRALPSNQRGDIPAAALTAYTREEDVNRALASGFQLHLSKPIEPDEIVAVVASLAGRTGKS